MDVFSEAKELITNLECSNNTQKEAAQTLAMEVHLAAEHQEVQFTLVEEQATPTVVMHQSATLSLRWSRTTKPLIHQIRVHKTIPTDLKTYKRSMMRF